LVGVATLAAWQLEPADLRIFDRYVTATESRMAREISGAAPFLWIDRQPADARARLLQRLAAGEVVSAKLRTPGIDLDFDNATLYHWIGTVLLSKVPLDRAVAYVKEYDRYPDPDRFGGMILRSKVNAAAADRFDVSMRTTMTKVITVVLDYDYDITYESRSPTRLTSTSVARRIFQVDSAGKPSERRRPVDEIDAFMWRLRTYCWFEQRAEGTYEQCESISLTRSVPFVARALGIGAIAEGIARDTLAFTLGRVRAGLVRPGGGAKP
jgi:hypothetical protein